MSLDNAAEVETADTAKMTDAERIASGDYDVFAEWTDRQLAEYTARTMASILAIAGEIQGQVKPVIDSLAGNPMFKMLLRK